MKNFVFRSEKGQSLIELMVTIGLAAVILPALLTGFVATRSGRAQAEQRQQAIALAREGQEATRVVREADWQTFAGLSNPPNTPYYLKPDATTWALTTDVAYGAVNGFTRTISISDVYRDFTTDPVSAPIVDATAPNAVFDPSTKKAVITVSWDLPKHGQIDSAFYLTRYISNDFFEETSVVDFTAGINSGTQVSNTAGGEVILANNNYAKWCSPALSNVAIDLPDGPPVAVAAMADQTSTGTPNDVFVAVAPEISTPIKLAYLTVTANTDPPVPTLKGTFTLDAGKYSNPSLVPTGINLSNNFKTNDVKYYKSPSTNKIYALLATDLPDHEVVAVLIKDASGNDVYQDPANKIYRYWTFFNTAIYGIGSGLDTGFLNPSANAAETSSAGDNNGFGSNPTRAYSDNSSFAVDTNSGSNTGTDCLGVDKDKHRFYNYNFSLPTGTTIGGIEVRLDAKVDSTVGAPKMCVQLSWDGGVTWTSVKSTNTLTTNETTHLLGGSSDTWGRTWSDTNFTNTNFRLRVINVASNISRDFSLDWAGVKVYFSGGVAPTNDQAPFNYGATTLTVLGDRGYVASGGYLYPFDLSNIDSKSSANGLDMVGCRIELDGYDCRPGSPATVKKYDPGQTGTSWGDTASAIHNDCSDGGNIELYATNDIYPVQVGSNTYIYVAVGGVTNPEFEIINTSTVPSYSRSIEGTCGRISGGDSSWKRISSYDFNSNSNTEEAANSVYAKSDGTRAYISSNGGIDGDHNGQPDSKQFYILNTSNKNSPAFLSGSPSSGPSSGYYYGTGANAQLYPRRSLTVLNGLRAILVGKDSVTDGNDAQEYQVLKIENEASPTYCGGVNFDQGFNDLTSVSEADGDNFVYMVANTMEKQLKIIQGGPDNGVYVPTGIFTSQTRQFDYPTAFNHFSATVNQPAQTTIKAQVAAASLVAGSCEGANFNYVGPNADPGQYFMPVGNTISGVIPFEGYGSYQNPNSCFKYKFYLDTTDFDQTPALNDIIVNYSP